MNKNITIVHINTFPYKAPGTIMLSIHQRLKDDGVTSYAVWGRGRNAANPSEFDINDSLGVKFHGVYTRLTDKTGFASKRATRKLIRFLEEKKPDIVHIHNIHGYYVNIEMLFSYLRNKGIRIVWTLHDCWSFTGHCAYFDRIGCSKWKSGCSLCPQKNTYPASMLLDASDWNWRHKRELFLNQDITIVVPCNWLKNVVHQSFLKDYNMKVIYNGVDTSIFRPVKINNANRIVCSLAQKTVILGVASEWTERKGLKDFVKLRRLLPEEEFAIVVVGLDAHQIENMPNGIVALARIGNIDELVELYSRADFFFNPTYEDNFPTTNLEALACGTKIITYDTGGSAECLNGGSENGWVLPKGAVDKAALIIRRTKVSSSKQNRLDEMFSKNKMLDSYIELYDAVLAHRMKQGAGNNEKNRYFGSENVKLR